MLDLLYKVYNDELNASIFYFRVSETIQGPDITNLKNELKIHAQEEFEHFQKLVSYMSNHGIKLPQSLIHDFTDIEIVSKEQALLKVQELEQIAINDYNTLCILAKEANDTEAYELFSDLLETETQHFDDFAHYLGQKRPSAVANSVQPVEISSVSESRLMSLKEFLNLN